LIKSVTPALTADCHDARPMGFKIQTPAGESTMKTRHLTITALAALLGLGMLFAKNNETEGNYEKWDQQQTVKMFDDSPWAQVQTYSFESPGGSMGQNEFKYQFTVRLFSAVPIRQAYVRMLQIMNHYDSLPPARQNQFDARVGGLATANVDDEIVVAVAYATNDPQGSRDMDQFFKTATTDTLNQSAYLYTTTAGQLQLKKYLPPNSGIGCRFIFPRSFNGKPVLTPEDKELRFQVYIPRIGQNLLVGFKPSNMMYDGKLAY
jgi:hypothetical protein